MFTRKEEQLLHDSYFSIIRETEQYVEVCSRNTGHCWNILKNTFEAKQQVILYHKHTEQAKYYHKHRECRTVAEAIDQIKDHDCYILDQQAKPQVPSTTRSLKVYEQSGYKYQPTPTIQLKGKWLEEYGFYAGTNLNIACVEGVLTITKV